MKKLLFFLCMVFMAKLLIAQSIGIGTTTPNSSSLLDLTSTSKGFLVPRMNTAERNAIASPTNGLMVYDITTGGYWYYNGSSWISLAAGGVSTWLTNSPNIYYNGGNVGIGTTAPSEKLTISNGQLRLSRTAAYDNNIVFNMPVATVASENQGLRFSLAGTEKAFIGYTSASSISTLGSYLRIAGAGVNANDLVINSVGNIGLGTNDPQEKLDVEGSIKSRNSITAGGNISGASLLSTGNAVIVGTTILNGTLTANGDINFNGTAPTLQLKTSNVDKGFLQLAGDDIRVGTNSSNVNGRFVIRTGGANRLYVDDAGNVSINTTTIAAGYKLHVGGKAICEELKVQLVASWPDYVFEETHKIMSLPALKNFISINKHLPGIPSAAEVKENGIEVGDMQKRMMEKIEELTLYVIQLQEQVDLLKKDK